MGKIENIGNQKPVLSKQLSRLDMAHTMLDYGLKNMEFVAKYVAKAVRLMFLESQEDDKGEPDRDS